IPHHSYWDALAQAKDLEYIISMMKKDKGGAKSMGRVPIDLNKPTWEIHSRGYEAGQVHPDWNS
ncbi:hypothetical protein QOZ73_32985, partial [Pseudomonas aeruginosa]|uniref:hypothetical protein n=1 Tax=Pseudomonas aeruginosa TaxID=287 RepID=UPI00345B4402